MGQASRARFHHNITSLTSTMSVEF
uniref:Uncharacterized protein n=1 Tax=Romanomermis culicivorax TaxID=13658 RepID=A0A915L151_ROMCU